MRIRAAGSKLSQGLRTLDRPSGSSALPLSLVSHHRKQEDTIPSTFFYDYELLLPSVLICSSRYFLRTEERLQPHQVRGLYITPDNFLANFVARGKIIPRLLMRDPVTVSGIKIVSNNPVWSIIIPKHLLLHTLREYYNLAGAIVHDWIQEHCDN